MFSCHRHHSSPTLVDVRCAISTVNRRQTVWSPSAAAIALYPWGPYVGEEGKRRMKSDTVCALHLLACKADCMSGNPSCRPGVTNVNAVKGHSHASVYIASLRAWYASALVSISTTGPFTLFIILNTTFSLRKTLPSSVSYVYHIK